MPPFAERLPIRRGPRLVVPLGLFTLGFVLMRSAAGESAGWLALLPGCLVAGAGLGLTNTSLTNTATAAVPAERVGMASGMDMSARMISLAINIALMGFLPLRGTAAGLEEQASAAGSVAIAALAETIAAGNLAVLEAMGVSAGAARAALTYGFGWVMLDAAACAWGLAALSLAAFGRDRQSPAERAHPCCGGDGIARPAGDPC